MGHICTISVSFNHDPQEHHPIYSKGFTQNLRLNIVFSISSLPVSTTYTSASFCPIINHAIERRLATWKQLLVSRKDCSTRPLPRIATIHHANRYLARRKGTRNREDQTRRRNLARRRNRPLHAPRLPNHNASQQRPLSSQQSTITMVMRVLHI